MQQLAEGLLPQLKALMQPGDEVLWPASQEPLKALEGRCWCPTPWALAQVKKAGLEVPPAPPMEVLRQVNHRRFAQQLGQALPLARCVERLDELESLIADGAALAEVSTEQNWLLKLPLGYAGRGRRKVAPGSLSQVDRTWVEAALRSGDGLQLEPLVHRELDCSLHGELSQSGMLKLGEPTVTHIDASGRWLASTRAPPGLLSPLELASLRTTAELTAQGLKRAGYFGPFGIDAFRWVAPAGSVHFQPRCEINARYSMGWAIGMGANSAESPT